MRRRMSDRFIAGSTKAKADPVGDLIDAVEAYLSEVDNPVPDYGYRRVVRDHMGKCLLVAKANREETPDV